MPGVALSWERKSPTTWIFKLRRDAKWSNGQPVTAADFVYSWRNPRGPRDPSCPRRPTGRRRVPEGRLPVPRSR
ncbi:ABC transporter substrate-binding protein [Streptomyces sp. NPDC005568]|uniref:ABC transporter substrate-binding protein n=1 Tax=Streptomyces sp. NPDC005568 TaxID=3156887 RepID=UPI0033A36D6E